MNLRRRGIFWPAERLLASQGLHSTELEHTCMLVMAESWIDVKRGPMTNIVPYWPHGLRKSAIITLYACSAYKPASAGPLSFDDWAFYPPNTRTRIRDYSRLRRINAIWKGKCGLKMAAFSLAVDKRKSLEICVGVRGIYHAENYIPLYLRRRKVK
jgi:hypothetical protein